MKTYHFFLLIGALMATETLDPNSVGEQLKILEDSTSKVPDSEATEDCQYVRRYKVQFKYATTATVIGADQTQRQHDHIYYMVLQCQNADKEGKQEKVYFSYTENGDFAQLPAGCPPPPIELPEEENPCAKGYEIGQVISNTVARIITPRLNSDDPAGNPVADTPQYQELERLKLELQKTPDSEELHKQLKAALSQYAAVAKDFADEKIKCFTEHVAEVKKVDIEFICADNSAHDSIKSALESALGNNIQCGTHLNCDDIEQQLSQNMDGVHHVAFEGIGQDINTAELGYQEGVADFNGNYPVPASGESYHVISIARNKKENEFLRFLGMKGGVFKNKGKKCPWPNETDKVVFEKVHGRFYHIRT